MMENMVVSNGVDEKVINFRLINTETSRKVPLKKDGHVKRIPNNCKEERWVHPIRSKEDVRKVIEYLHNKAMEANTEKKHKAAYRDWLLFVIGINVGLRVSDLIRLTWSHIYNDDMKTFTKAINIKEEKTGKMKTICLNHCMKDAVLEYLKETNTVPVKGEDKFIFLNSRTGNKITDATVEKMIKKFTAACVLDGNFNTHTLRKTYAYHKYMMYVKNNDPLALIKVQKDLNHRNSSDTATYLGITRDEKIKSSMELGDYWDVL